MPRSPKPILLAAVAAASASIPAPALAAVDVWNLGDWQIEGDASTGALVGIAHARDLHAMNWIREPGRWDNGTWKADLSPEAKTRGGQWGLVETSHSGLLHTPRSRSLSENVWEQVYQASSLTVTVHRELHDEALLESYTFTNTGMITIDLPPGSVSIAAPLFDQYPDARRSLTDRCHAHIWTGGATTWINAIRMGAEAPHLGLVVTQGAFDSYSQRAATYSDRGIFLLHPAAMSLPRGKSVTLAWKLFWHQGWDDFFAKVSAERNVVRLSAARQVVEVGESLEITARSAGPLDKAVITANGHPVPTRLEGEVLRATIPASAPGEVLVELTRDGARSLLRANVVASPDSLIEARLRFIVAHQQRAEPGAPADGAYLAFDNETGRQVYFEKVNDHNAGRERVAMGVLGALWLPRCRDEAFKKELAASLDRYAAFVARELEGEDGTVYGNVGRKNWERLYNFPWFAHFHLAMYRATGDAGHLDRMLRVFRSYYTRGGAKYYAIGIRVTDSLAALAEAGRAADRAELLALFRTHADTLLKIGTDYPPFEVNYEQSIVAPAVQLLLEVHLATGEPAYLEGAKKQLPVLEAFAGRQPDHRLNEVSIRHWDDFWFGKIRVYGDTFPHYWSALNSQAYAYYGKAVGDASWLGRARDVCRANLSLFASDGTASCAHLYARGTNGVPGKRNDPWANDQDWALVYLLLTRELTAGL